MKLVLFASLVLAGCSYGIAEDTVKMSDAPIKVSFDADGLFIGPNPNNMMERFRQLYDMRVQDLLGLQKDVGLQVHRITQHYFQRSKEVSRIETEAGRTKASQAILRQFQENAENYMDEVLTPAQDHRLTQIIYRIETKRLGLGEALATGRLGLAVGVHDNQKSNIKRKAEAIQEKLEKEIAKLCIAAEAELFAELAPEQRDKVVDLLGEDFSYHEKTPEQKMFENLRDRYEADPEGFIPIAGMPKNTNRK
ncbi:MAG: hypothetical protein AAF483_08535 [Planctomycetota bacterium]